ncbi:MAG: hypothetical protein E5299_01597 [Burkholderia gladioli]|nr:MAG: hypothetical protein E5299_01597 [Burkholderia gladioli]
MKPFLPEYSTPYPRVVTRVYTAIRLIQALLNVKTVYQLMLRAPCKVSPKVYVI